MSTFSGRRKFESEQHSDLYDQDHSAPDYHYQSNTQYIKGADDWEIIEFKRIGNEISQEIFSTSTFLFFYPASISLTLLRHKELPEHTYLYSRQRVCFILAYWLFFLAVIC